MQFRIAIALSVVLIGAATAAADEVVHDFRGGKFDQDLLRFDGPANARDFYTPEEQGLRVRINYGKSPRGTVGVAWNSSMVRGDFTATAHYEILENERPKGGYGTGIELYLYLDVPPKKEGQSREAIAFVRLARPVEGYVFRFARMTYDDADRRIQANVQQLPADPEKKRGRLRLARQGPTLIASFAEDDDGPFQELQRHDIGVMNIRMVRVAGTGSAPLDARILEMRLEGPELRFAGKPIVAEPPPGSPPPEQTAPGQRVYWMLWATGGVVVLFLAFVVIVRWRHAQKPATTPADADANTGMIGLVCSACGKNLKVKEENAGKRVKCPGCGQHVQVPAPT